ncbi:3-phosphoserine/phosphohydroxythreonine transaminase [Rurimicrobium arvi]|uniref:Phosphoserine aminotransferase n=1 Tax=Rurimicrobium arvi TaxID=2049916 RepID=A0ABP8MJR7_9BACT
MSAVKINFGAGPAALPVSVTEQLALSIRNYDGSGLSVLEIPHRGKLFDAILKEANERVLQLCNLDAATYEVLWLQGGGRLQFAMIPMNFLPEAGAAGYVDSGFWSSDAMENATLWGNTINLASSKDCAYKKLPEIPERFPENLSYIHLTTNNTIYGTQWKQFFNSPVPLFADMSSDIFSERRDYGLFDLFYAVAQKNIGIAGVTLVVLKKSLLTKVVRPLNPYLSYRDHVAAHSVLNTAPVFAVYSALLMLRYISDRGIAAIEEENLQKAGLLYDTLEKSVSFELIAEKNSRSNMNVVFRGIDPETENNFKLFCDYKGIEGIEGHRRVGGFRASLYNAIRLDQVQYLANAITEFDKTRT